MTAPVIDVEETLNLKRLSGFQIWVLTCCVIVELLDGFDVNAMAFVAPAISSQWQISSGVFGTISASGSSACCSGIR